MEKKYRIENLCCANCAMVAERKANKVPGVKKAEINFMMQKLIIDYEDGVDIEAVKAEVVKAIQKVEAEAIIK